MTKEEMINILKERIKAVNNNYSNHREEALTALSLAIKVLNELESIE